MVYRLLPIVTWSSYICVYMLITTIFQQMAVKCLEEEAPFYSHRNPGVMSLDLAGRKDEKVSGAE